MQEIFESRIKYFELDLLLLARLQREYSLTFLESDFSENDLNSVFSTLVGRTLSKKERGGILFRLKEKGLIKKSEAAKSTWYLSKSGLALSFHMNCY